VRGVRREALGIGLVAIAMSLGACQRESTVVAETFASTYSCPAQQITVANRPDLVPYDVSSPWRKPAAPPDEVKSDPARLAVWQANQAKANDHSGYNKRRDVLEATGCGHHALYVCSAAWRDRYNHVWCDGPY
jgi:hypothetical protein